MIPSPQELATLALRRRQDFSRRLAEVTAQSGAISLLPTVLRRCIVTTAVCQQVLVSLDRVVSASIRGLPGRGIGSADPDGGAAAADGTFARLWRSHFSLAVNRALVAYGEILRTTDWRVQRQAMDSFLEFLSSIEVLGGLTDRPQTLKALMDGANRIRALLEARRPQTAITGMLFRDHESLNAEATAWCYCAALLELTLKSRADGTASVKLAVNAVDAVRAGLEKALTPAPSAASAKRPPPRAAVAAKA